MSLLTQPLCKSDRPGHVYAFVRESSPGYVNISRATDGAIKQTVVEVQSCNYSATIVADNCQQPTAWSKQLERLVYAELIMHRRKERHCNNKTGCPTVHDEWFEMEGDAAAATIERWRAWINLGVYDARTRKLSRNWADRLQRKPVHETWEAWLRQWMPPAESKDLSRIAQQELPDAGSEEEKATERAGPSPATARGRRARRFFRCWPRLSR
jgi:hypothetical protein